MIYCKLHPDAGTIIRVKGPHIGVYCKQCGKWLKWIKINEIDNCIKPELDESLAHASLSNTNTHAQDDDDIPW